MFNILRSKEASSLRTGIVCTADGCAIATIRRSGANRRVLANSASVSVPAADQKSTIAGWFGGDRGERGAVCAVLDQADYQLLLVESPDVLAAELKAAVRWRLKDAIDFPVDEAVVDVFEIPEQLRRTGSKMMYAIAAKRRAVETQVALLKPAARRFDVIDIPELALRNLAAFLPEANDGLILLWLRADSAQLLVIKQSTLYLARQVPFGSGVGDEESAAAAEVEAVALELQRSMDYFESHYEQAPIRHLIVAPGGARAERLVRALATETAMQPQVIDVGQAVDVPAEFDATDGRLLLAIGAALRDDQKKL